MVKIYVARHGNTFDKGDTILRVGKRTDLPISKSGSEQSKNLAKFIDNNNYQFDKIYCSNLKRTQQTAEYINEHFYKKFGIEKKDFLDEIDYGIDDGKPEKDVQKRLGKETISLWEEKSILPDGWNLNIQDTKEQWKLFSDEIISNRKSCLVVTSNGIARFVLDLVKGKKLTNNNKMKTCAISCIAYANGEWNLEFWNRYYE